MNSKIIYQPGRLQQQPHYPANREQQQSSGFGELQPRYPSQSAPAVLPASAGGFMRSTSCPKETS